MATLPMILVAVAGLSLLVIVHETGHYLAARFFGMRVLRYSIGIGPTLFKYQPKDSPTTFQVCAIPALAYVQIAGMNPFEDIDHSDPTLFPNKSILARIVTVAAGPAANYLLASIFIFGVALTGWPQSVVSEVRADSPAQRAGVQVGDEVVSANGHPIYTFDELIQETSGRAGQQTEYVFRRNGKRVTFLVTPEKIEGRGVIGIVRGAGTTLIPMPAGEAAVAAFVVPYRMTLLQFKGIADQFKRRTTEGMMGPVGMGKVLAQTAKRSFLDYAFVLVMISVALGLFNLMPFPALDGGRLMFLGYELITQKRPNAKVEAVINTLGILVLLGVFVMVTARDLFWS